MGSRAFWEGLYDLAAGAPDENGVPKFDEQKFRKNLEQNDKLGRRNRDIFRIYEPKFQTCPRYNPCPICDKCQNKASHLYVECQECRINTCAHKYADRVKMIKRKNFVEYVDKDTMNKIREMAKKVREKS